MIKKLKYQGGATRLICRKQAELNKQAFGKNTSSPEDELILKANILDFDIISFSGISNYEDQILSIYSLLYYAGKPFKWTIYSDKSYTKTHKDVFERKFDFVEVKEWDVYDHYTKIKPISDYLNVCPLGKKLNIILGHECTRQTMYLDSDIIFYKNSPFYLNNALLSKGLWYAPDALGEVGAYFSIERESIYPLNSGLLILNKSFNAEDIYEYLENLKGDYCYFSEQSSFEYAFRKQGANMLDPRQFVIDTSDQFDFSMNHHPGDIAMRHYTSPVRHKMWQKGWKWHFDK